MESALLAVHSDVDAMGATRGVKADMVKTNSKRGSSTHLFKNNGIGDG